MVTAKNSPFASILHTCPCDSSNGTVSRTSPARSHTSTEHRPARNTASRQIAKAPDEPPDRRRTDSSSRTRSGLPGAPPRRAIPHQQVVLADVRARHLPPIRAKRSRRSRPVDGSTTTVSADACATEIPSRTLSCRRTRTHTRAPSALNAPMSRDRGPNARDSRRAAPASTLASSRHRDSGGARVRLRPRRSLRNQNRQPRHPRRDGSSSFSSRTRARRVETA